MDVVNAKDADIDSMCDFIARYVRKVHSDAYIRSTMRKMPGESFLEFIGPSNIAYLLAVFKNGQETWDQEIRMRAGAGGQTEKKLRPLFSTGDGKKREIGKSLWNNHFSPSHHRPHYYYYYSLGKSLWNNDGRRYFNNMEGKWMNIYKSKAAMTRLYKRWDNWIETKGKEIQVGDGSKTFQSVMGTWYDKNDDETGGGTNDDIDEIGEYEDNDGYSDLKSRYSFHSNAWKEGEKNSADNHDYDNGSDDSGNESDSSSAGVEARRQATKTGSKKGGKMSGGISGGGRAKTGSRAKKDPNPSDDNCESDSSSAQVVEMAAGMSGGGSAKTGSKNGSAKAGKRGGETTAGIAKTGSKRGGKISDGGSPAMHTRKRLYEASTEAGEAGKRKG